MSGILGVFPAGSKPADPVLFEKMMAAGRKRGRDRRTSSSGPWGALGIHRFEWEFSACHSGETMVLRDGGVVLAVDGSVYYRAELRRGIEAAGVDLSGDDSSHLILGAYRAWGTDCLEKLDGNYAFVLVDLDDRRVVCGRDLVGSRPLFFCEARGGLLVSSSIAPLLEHPDVSNDLNLARIGATAAGLPFSLGTDTCYRDIEVVPSAGGLSWVPGGRAKTWRCWRLQDVAPGPVPPFEEAAEILRGLLQEAVTQRLCPDGHTTVWMSGGRDSTAVFAVGQAALREGAARGSLTPVSVSYPEGDPGREDEIISAVGEFWDTPIHWLDIGDIPLIDRMEAQAARREEPAAHIYENFNVALAEGTRACGSRVALEGNGGDQLFGAGSVFLADLLRTRRWRELIREARLRRGGGPSFLIQSALLPLVPPWLLWAGGPSRDWRPFRHYLERPVPPWIRRDFIRRTDLIGREWRHLPPLEPGPREAAEMRWFVSSPMPGYMGGQMSNVLLEAGVDIRSPLFDRNIIEFALSRPREERVRGIETKRLLRRSIRGLLPDYVLAPRERRSGVAHQYSRDGMARGLPPLFSQLFQGKSLLSELGIIDLPALKAAIGRFLDQKGEHVRLGLFHTVQTEFWLRAHLGG